MVKENKKVDFRIQSYSERNSRLEVEEMQKWREEIDFIPFIQFPSDWKIQIIPAFGDAVVRFRVKLPCDIEKSIYLDSRESLGYYGGPYWEVYPFREDVGRCKRSDVDGLLAMIADTTEGKIN